MVLTTGRDVSNECLVQLADQQKQIVNLLNTLVAQSTNPQMSAATHDQQSTPAAGHSATTCHQGSTSADNESSILEDLLELTSDEEFTMSLSSLNPSSHQMTQPSPTQPTAPVSQAPLQQRAPLLDPLPQLFAPVMQPPQPPTPVMQPPQPPTPVMQPPQPPTPVMQPPQPPTPVMQPPQLTITPSTSATLQTLQPDTSSEARSAIQKPPFDTPPKLLPVERVMMDYPGTVVASLRRLTTALARDAIFGREALCRSSLSGKNNTGCLEKHKLDYIKAVVKSRVPNMPEVAFEGIWSKCRSSLSKSCQTLRTNAKKKIIIIIIIIIAFQYTYINMG